MTGFGYNVSGFGSFPSRGLPPYTIELIVVGGGGGGGSSGGGGGGAGTYRELTVLNVPSGLTWTATIGAGGAGGSSNAQGGYTQLSGTGLTTVKSIGGGRGVGASGSGGNGGSGGGGSRYNLYQGNPLSGGSADTSNGSGGTAYAHAGSSGAGGSFSYWVCMGGNGGGAAYAGQVNGGNHNYGTGSVGIAGWSGAAANGKYFGPSSLGFGFAAGGSSAGFGTSVYYSLAPASAATAYGGGQGAWYNNTSTSYGASRASPVVNQAATAASANSGSGGGAGHPHGGAGGSGAAGGSGVVMLRYAGEQRATGGTVSSHGGYTYHKITSSGNFIT